MTYKLIFGIILFCSSVIWATPWLGLSYKKETFDNHLALHIIGVHPESGAFSSGIVSGDKIIEIEGKTLIDISQVQNALVGKKPGQKVKIQVFREGVKKNFIVSLTNRPDDISSLTGSAIGSKIENFGENFYKNGDKRKTKPKATLLDFWATWCSPCRKTLPVLANIYNKYGSKGLEIIGISSEDKNTLNLFYERQHKSPYPLYEDRGQKLWRRYGIRAVPTLMLLDENGYIKKVWSGAPTESMIEHLLKEVL